MTLLKAPGRLGPVCGGRHRGAAPLILSGLTGLGALLLGACAVTVESGPPIANPGDLAEELGDRTGEVVPALLRFDWRYADRRGEVEGQGVGRYNPPDSLRVDLFTSGDVAMAVAVADGELRSLGEIEDVGVPGLAFVYAMAGLFRPGYAEAEAYVVGEDSVLVYAAESDTRTYFYVRETRLHRVEEKHRGRTVQRVKVDWEGEGRWPVRAEYRNLSAHSRVRWDMGEITNPVESHPAHIYDLPPVP